MPARAEVKLELLAMVTRPAGCGADEVADVVWFEAPGALACVAPSVLKSTPDEAVVTFDMTVLLAKFTNSESCNETPPPSQPATLLAMMLLVTSTEYHLVGVLGKLVTSVPFTDCRRVPPQLPLSAALPITRMALIFRPRPVPSLKPAAQSMSVTEPHSAPVGAKPSGAEPMIMMPP